MNAENDQDFLEVALRSVWFLYREALTANAGRLADVFEGTIAKLEYAAGREDQRPSKACMELLNQFHAMRIFNQMEAGKRAAAVQTIEEIDGG